MALIDRHDNAYLGMAVREVAAQLGLEVAQTRAMLDLAGYRVRGGVLTRNPSVTEVEDQIQARLATLRSPYPCGYCGCRECQCRREKAA